jgi:HK97 family phage major capsid protein
MTAKIHALHEQRTKLANDMSEIVKIAEKEDRGFSGDEKTNWENLRSEIDATDERIRVLTEQERITAERHVAESAGTKRAESGRPTHREAFVGFVRSHPEHAPMSAEHRAALQEYRAQATGTPTAGGYLVPQEWASSIEEAMKDYGGIRSAATVISTATGATLNMPTDDDTTNSGAILGENVEDGEQDVAVGEVELGAYKYTSRIVRVPIELLQDSAWDVEAWLQRKFGERLGRATSAHYATGTGTNQPRGLMVAAAAGPNAGAAAAISWADLIALKHSVDPAYRRGPKVAFGFNDSTLKAIKSLLDGNDRPIWQPGVSVGAPDTIDGDRYFVDQGIANIGTGARSVVYGDIGKYIIRDVMGISMARLVERYAEFHQVGFVAILRTDADLLDAGTGPVKALIHP